MVPSSLSNCDCCGLHLFGASSGGDCPRCGYPVDALKEEQFLQRAVGDLQRVAAYGGANLTIIQLIRRYRARLSHLLQQKTLADVQREPLPVLKPSEQATAAAKSHSEEQILQSSINVPKIASENLPVAAPTQGSQRPPEHMFSLKSFLEDHTINIVASLGAFLILLGSLSFVATTTNSVLSFIMMFLVHAAFGVVGIISYRFKSFRIVAVIYTAIFALLVPLVGFSGYRLVSGTLIHLETPLLVTIASAYAAIIYGALALYQRFSPFAYLSMVALIVADLALAVNFHLAYWWWPSMLMGLALPALAAVSAQPRPRFFGGFWSMLREPVRVLMFTCIAVCIFGIISTFLYALQLHGSSLLPEQREVRLALTCMLTLLFCWSCLFVWRTKQINIALSIPILFPGCVLSVAYTLHSDPTGYVAVLVVVALLYHALVRLAGRYLQSFGQLSSWLDALALLLATVIPFIAFPYLLVQLIVQAFRSQTIPLLVTRNDIIGQLAVAGGLFLTLSVIQHRTGFQRHLTTKQSGWPWLFLLSGFFLNTAFSMVVLWLNVVPAWGFLGLTLLLLVLTVAVRLRVSASWALPLDVLAFSGIVQTLLLGMNQSIDVIISLLLFFATLVYGIALYQRRAVLLLLPMALFLLAFPFLLLRLPALYLLCLAFPLIAALQYRLITYRLLIDAPIKTGLARAIQMKWEWPLLATGVLYGWGLALSDAFAPVSTVQGWLHLASPFTAGQEVALIAIVWYAAAAVARIKWWLAAAVCFAFVALLMPSNSFWVLTWLAPLLALLAFGVSRLAGRDWALPFYATAIFGAVMMGITGYAHGLYLATTWALLVFALDMYLVGYVEREPVLLWVAVVFAVASVYCSGLVVGGFYRFFPPIVALACAAIGIGIGCLKWLAPDLAASKSATAKHGGLLQYSLPLYAIALLAAVMNGIYGLLAGVNNPFYTAIPDALLVYALVAYIVVRFEGKPQWQWLVAGFAIWATVLVPQLVTAPEYVFGGVCLSNLCRMQAQNILYYLGAIALVTGALALLLRSFNHRQMMTGIQAKFVWNWSWYLSSLAAILATATWGYGLKESVGILLPAILCAFILLSLLIMLLERAPEVLLVAVSLSAWTLSLVHWNLWQQMIGYTLLCVLIFGSQFVWQKLPSATLITAPRSLHQILGLAGQICVVLAIIGQGGLLANTGLLAHVGAGSLLVLAALLFWYGRLQSQAAIRRWCAYGAGLLLSLLVSWELSALGQTHIDVLVLVPASYLIVIAPFLSRDETLPYYRRAGQFCSVAGAALLLAPELWLSFSVENLSPTLILGGEALLLLLLGAGLRVRFFVLSGAGLVIVAAMHALFLPSLGLPLSLALTILGGTLLAIATLLSLARHRLHAAWTRWQ